MQFSESKRKTFIPCWLENSNKPHGTLACVTLGPTVTANKRVGWSDKILTLARAPDLSA